MNDAILDVSEGDALKGVHDQRPGPPPAATGDANDLDVLADVPNEKVARLKTRQARRVPSHFDLLLHRDANPEQTSSAGVTALMEACVMGKESCIRILLENHADVDHLNNNGQTALMFACANGHDNCVRLLCEFGASKTIVDAEGKAPADFARVRKHSSIAAWLEASFLRSGFSRSSSRTHALRSVGAASTSCSMIGSIQSASQSRSHAASVRASSASDTLSTAAWAGSSGR